MPGLEMGSPGLSSILPSCVRSPGIPGAAGWWLTTGSLQHRRKGSWPKAQNSRAWAATTAATKDQSCENYTEFSPFSPNNTSYFDLKSRQLLGITLKIHPWIPGHCEEAHWELWYLSIYLSLPPWLLPVLLQTDVQGSCHSKIRKHLLQKKNVLFTCTYIHAFSLLIYKREYSCWALGETNAIHTHRISELLGF